MTGYLALPGLHHFGVLLIDGGAGHHHPGTNYVGGRVTQKNGGAEALQAVGNAGLAQIGAGNGVAQGQQNLRYAAHPDAANANEMNALRFRKHGRRGQSGEAHVHLMYQPPVLLPLSGLRI